ncbi:NADH dehydrogenase [ubiquinone] 1 beta subcomplex subunit 4 isoform X1 [Vespa velutina]|uniref:NADH dehydrogenase [ubiquinone] 1 beta subcomplex subunit 4 isoform X1 n=3 Tax=Vespa velutina TaxID=202808 RepID=UPI001FB28F97|nr:NADH dehydrogenase [ubiquinone] 1 beta subcomplex subunit 4 isoform X1 [Vespa velutina]
MHMVYLNTVTHEYINLLRVILEYVLREFTRIKIMSENKIYDLSKEDQEVKEWKASRRLELRNEYLKEIQDPRRIEPVIDKGWLRFYATRVQLEHIFIQTPLNTLLMYTIVGGLLFSVGTFLKKSKDRKEQLYRTGQVKYVDRMFKFH